MPRTPDGRPYRVRRAKPSDAGRILDHALAIAEEAPETFAPGVELTAERVRVALRTSDIALWLAESGGEVIGTLSMAAGEIGMSVRKAWRRQGVATALLCELPGEDLSLRVRPQNLAARRLYESAGFLVLGREGDYLRMGRSRIDPRFG